MREIRIGIIGVGVVGSSVVKILKENQEIISDRIGARLVVKKGVVRDLSKDRGLDIPLSDEIDSIIKDPEIDVVIELMGGVEEAFGVAKRVLSEGKSLVTANKAMLAYHRYELQAIAKDIPIGFEASVCGGIPVIKVLKDGLGANHILSIQGILNGTSNYILTQMIQNNQSFQEALKAAQNLGYAEADPTLDISGGDAGHKLLVLASLAYGIDARPEDIVIEGIENISPEDIAFASEFDFVIKLLGIAKKVGDEVELRTHPVLIDKRKMIAKVDGVMNAISVVGDRVGETLYYGAGAGGDATASAVISDLIEIARGKSSAMLGFERNRAHFKLRDRAQIKSRYYIRLSTYDRTGVLAKVSSILSQNGISIQAFLQKEATGGVAKLLFITHISQESSIQHALKEIDSQDFIECKSHFIRIED